MHKVQRPSETSQSTDQSRTPFPVLDDVAVQLFIDHAVAKLKSSPPVVKAELKSMVPSGPPLGEHNLYSWRLKHKEEPDGNVQIEVTQEDL